MGIIDDIFGSSSDSKPKKAPADEKAIQDKRKAKRGPTGMNKKDREIRQLRSQLKKLSSSSKDQDQDS
jgi:hypothetical protein